MNEHTGRLGFPRPALFVVINIEAGEGAQEDSATAVGTLSQSHPFLCINPQNGDKEICIRCQQNNNSERS